MSEKRRDIEPHLRSGEAREKTEICFINIPILCLKLQFVYAVEVSAYGQDPSGEALTTYPLEKEKEIQKDLTTD